MVPLTNKGKYFFTTSRAVIVLTSSNSPCVISVENLRSSPHPPTPLPCLPPFLPGGGSGHGAPPREDKRLSIKIRGDVFVRVLNKYLLRLPLREHRLPVGYGQLRESLACSSDKTRGWSRVAGRRCPLCSPGLIGCQSLFFRGDAGQNPVLPDWFCLLVLFTLAVGRRTFEPKPLRLHLLASPRRVSRIVAARMDDEARYQRQAPSSSLLL